MTAPTYDPATDPAQQFLHTLPPAVRNTITSTARITVLIHRAVHQHGWTVPQLTARCTGNLGGNPAGVITHRLEHCANQPPTTDTASHRLPFCSPECRDNAGWITDNNGLPIGRCRCRTPQGAT